jgi:hypothetical protein
VLLALVRWTGLRSQQRWVQKAAFHEGAIPRNFDMHRSYRYKEFTSEVDAEPIEGIPNGKLLSLPAGYIALVHISLDASSRMIRQLSFGQDCGRP